MKTARVGLTSNDITFLKQAYSREPCAMGSNTLELMNRTLSPRISSRMGQDLDTAFESANAIAHQKAPREDRLRTPPSPKRMVGGKILTRSYAEREKLHPREDEYISPLDGAPLSTGRSLSTTRSELDMIRGDSARTGRSSYRGSARGNNSSRSQLSVRSSARGSARASARVSQRGGTQRGSCRDSTRSSVAGETARLRMQKEELQERLLAISTKLKDAITKPEIDPAFDPEVIKEDSMGGYSRDAGYRSFNRNRYGTQDKMDFPIDRERPFTPKKFQQMTEMGRYAEALAKNRDSLPYGVVF